MCRRLCGRRILRWLGRPLDIGTTPSCHRSCPLDVGRALLPVRRRRRRRRDGRRVLCVLAFSRAQGARAARLARAVRLLWRRRLCLCRRALSPIPSCVIAPVDRLLPLLLLALCQLLLVLLLAATLALLLLLSLRFLRLAMRRVALRKARARCAGVVCWRALDRACRLPAAPPLERALPPPSWPASPPGTPPTSSGSPSAASPIARRSPPGRRIARGWVWAARKAC